VKLLRTAGFLWDASCGYRLRPWASPYIRWRMETYSGMHAEQIDKAAFWAFLGQERRRLLSFLKWAGEMRG
jgi:hypothetical protein